MNGVNADQQTLRDLSRKVEATARGTNGNSQCQVSHDGEFDLPCRLSRNN